MSVYVVFPGDFSSDTDASSGKTSPLARRPENARTLCIGSRDATAASRPSAKARSSSTAFISSGKKRAIDVPTASELGQQNIRSAAELKSVIVLVSSKRM